MRPAPVTLSGCPGAGCRVLGVRGEVLLFLALALVWVGVRLPNLSGEFGLKMDAASAGVAWFIDESWSKDPSSRIYCPVDHREQLEELRTGVLAPYLHAFHCIFQSCVKPFTT
ncbi:MAG: hypothetical protein HQL31_11835 [Planctomycetes bacterium]|nr:hypothetical protein [Planctomycetota bacterium]